MVNRLQPDRLRANAETELRIARRAWWELRQYGLITPTRWEEVTAAAGEIATADIWAKVDIYQNAIRQVKG